MTTYGYRIHTLEPRLGRARELNGAMALEDVSAAGGDTDAFEQFKKELLELQDAKTQLGTPAFYVDEITDAERQAKLDETDGVPYFEVTDVQVEDRRIRVTVETGREQDHDALVSRDGTHEPIERKAAVRGMQVVLLFPQVGPMAIMLSEVRGQTYVGELLIKWLTRRAQHAAVTVNADNRKIVGPFLNWHLTPMIDGARLDGILGHAADPSFRLRRRGVSAAGTRTSYDLEVVQWGLKKTTAEKVFDTILAMAARKGSTTELDRRKAAANDVIQLVDPAVSRSGIEYDDAEISIVEKGKRQTINAETVDKLFIYPLGSTRPKGYQLVKEAAPVVNRIARALKITTTLPE
jgi:hypothetical protein